MKINDLSLPSIPQSSGKLSDRLRNFLKFGLSGEKDRQAQQAFVAHTSKLLNNQYTLLCNVKLPGLDIPIPLILIGPTGIRTIYPSALRGIYRAKNDAWYVMDSGSQHFKPASPNLVARAQLMARAIETYLLKQGQQQEVEPALFFSQAGVHVDTIRPAVRVVLTDAADRFVAGIVQTRPTLNAATAEQIVTLLSKPAPEPPQPTAAKALAPKPKAAQPLDFRLTRRQWLILGAIALFEIFILLALVVIILR